MEQSNLNGGRQWSLHQSSTESDSMQEPEQTQETRRRGRRTGSTLRDKKPPPEYKHPAGISKRVQQARKNPIDPRNVAQYTIQQQQSSIPTQKQPLTRNLQQQFKSSPASQTATQNNYKDRQPNPRPTAPKAVTQQNILGMQQFSPQQTIHYSSHRRFQNSPTSNTTTQQHPPRDSIDPIAQYSFLHDPSGACPNFADNSSRELPKDIAPKAKKRNIGLNEKQQLPLCPIPPSSGSGFPKPQFFSCFYRPGPVQTHGQTTAFDPSHIVSIPRSAQKLPHPSYKDASSQTDITMEPSGSHLGVRQPKTVSLEQTSQVQRNCDPAPTQKEPSDMGVNSTLQLQLEDTRTARLKEIGMNPLTLYEWSHFENAFNKEGSGDMAHGQEQESFETSSTVAETEIPGRGLDDPTSWDGCDDFGDFFGMGQSAGNVNHGVAKPIDGNIVDLDPIDWVGNSWDFGGVDVVEELI